MHLLGTVEELKKFNTRRRLMGAILNAASSPRWALISNDALSDVDQFSDFNSDEGTSKGKLAKCMQILIPRGEKYNFFLV